ncbi:hypothetical protein GW796_00335 [archaeon]|nr:hypothetical protein [archaeon]
MSNEIVKIDDNVVVLSDLYENYNINELKTLVEKLEGLEINNNKAFESLMLNKNITISSIKTAWNTKDQLSKLKGFALKSISEIQTQKSQPLIEMKDNIEINEQTIILSEKDLIPVKDETSILSTNIGDSQFLYNYKQDKIMVTNEMSFEIEIFFEQLVQIPLKITSKKEIIAKDLSFEVSF